MGELRRRIGRTVAATVLAVALAAPAASAGDIVIRRDGSKAVDVTGTGRLALCPCEDPPVSIGISGARVEKDGELFLS